MKPQKKSSPPPALFDTLRYAKKLQAAGFTQEQAEVQAETFLEVVQEQLVRKQDLQETEGRLTLEIEKVRLDIETVRKDLTIDIENVRKEVADVRKDLTIEIEALRKDLTIEIENVRKELKTDIELLRRDLKIWFGGMLVIVVTVLPVFMTVISHWTR